MIEPLRVVEIAPQLLAFIPIKVARENIREAMTAGLAELEAGIEAQHIMITGAWMTHHLRRPSDVFDFELCMPVAVAVSPQGRIKPGQWPAMSAAQTIYHGGYEGLGEAWGRFLKEIEAGGHVCAEDFWECYITGPKTSADPATYRTELTKPFASKT
jgi:effector-binding domain-containing protein